MSDLIPVNENNAIEEITPDEQALIDTINSEIEQGRERALLAMDREKKITYWNIGKHIKTHLLKNEDRAEYGKYLFNILAEKTNIDRTTLYRTVQLYDVYPDFVAVQRQLTWSHLKILVTIPDKETRQAYEEKIIADNLTENDFKALIRKDKGLPEPEIKELPPVLIPQRDKPYVYRIAEDEGKIEIELGFRVTRECPFPEVNPGEVVQVEKNGQQYSFIPTNPKVSPHYMYKAKVLEILDGDTFWVKIDLGFKTKIEQKIRFRGLNTEDVETPQGKTAKDYIVARLKGCKFIAIKSYWRDKFDRYLVDVFYDKNETDFEKLIQNGKYLNQEILDKGLAVRYEE